MGTIKQNRANNILTSGKIDATDGLNNNIPAANIANSSLSNVTAFPPSAGAGVSQLASDPPSPTEGQMWYNTTTNTLKQYSLGAGAWATGGALNTARGQNAGAGVSNASGLTFGGTPIPGVTGKTEQYDGTTWTEVNDMNYGGVNIGGSGTATSALASGREDALPTQPNSVTESWNGTSWTEVADLNAGRARHGAVGADNTSALCISGLPPPAATTAVEQWNGSSWTEIADVNDGRWAFAANGTVTSALIYGGSDVYDSPPRPDVAVTESWNGSAWTEVNDLNTARRELASGGVDNTSALAFGGEAPPSETEKANTEEWNGVSWAETTDLNSARNVLAGNGVTASALAYGGNPGPGVVTSTEEWTKAVSVQTITAS